MDTPLLATKFYISRRRPDRIPRARLLAGLNSDLWQDDGFARRLTLVCAPAGFGKTTLLTEWLQGVGQALPGREPLIAWLSLDPDDNDLQRFLAYLVGAFRHARPDVLADTQQLLVTPQVPTAKTVLTLMINGLAQHGRATRPCGCMAKAMLPRRSKRSPESVAPRSWIGWESIAKAASKPWRIIAWAATEPYCAMNSFRT